MLFTLRGTPTMYYGDEIGMHDVAIPPELMVDPQEKDEPGLVFSRDPERTPMQWDNTSHAGFSSNQPWLPVALDYEINNVAQQSADPNSMLSFYRRLIQLRQSEPALQVGDYIPVGVSQNILVYIRSKDHRRFLIALNLSHTPGFFESEYHSLRGHILFSTHPAHEGKTIESRIFLEDDQGIIALLED